jgi:thiamine kinase-like enzyme
LVVGFLQGRTLTAADVREPAVLPRLAAAVRVLHQGPEFAGGFDMRAIRRRYLDIVVEHGFRLPEDYLDLTGRVDALERAMEPGAETLVPCNNDLLAANFIDDGAKIWLIDYEYSGMNEPSFELGNLASESDLDLAGTAALVSAYWDSPAPDKLARARAWSLLARYGWTLWASIQDGVSPIDFDFWSWGMAKYRSARAELLSGAFDEIVAGLSGPGRG